MFLLLLGGALYSCANVGRPEGGPVDEMPPRFVRSTPVLGALNQKKGKIILDFDEIIKIEKVSEKVVISPPQAQQPEIRSNGRRITINLLDSLKSDFTYTIDFADAIVDNNEGNPMGEFAFTFSTGTAIDTMSVKGTLLHAENLEPIKGVLVGLHTDLNDSAFTKLPLNRVGRTDSRGRFSIRGIAPGKYRIYALQDVDQNFFFNQKSELIAWNDSLIIPTMEQRTRMDTLWKDSLTIDTIRATQYTHFLPDDIVLRGFNEELNQQYLVKSERLIPQKFSLYFAAKADTLPTLTGLNFNEKDAFIIEKTSRNDSLHYWISDSLIYKMDTLKIKADYLFTDTLNRLIPRTDTLSLAVKKAKGSKEIPKKKKKKSDDEPEVEPTKFLQMRINAPQAMEVYGTITLNFEEPIARFDSAGIHLREKVDSLWKEIPFFFARDSLNLKQYNMYTDWKPTVEYELEVDSTCFHGIYGLFTNKVKQNFKVRSLDEYGAIYFNVSGADSLAYVELLDPSDKPLRTAKVVDGKADFYYLAPGKYSARLVNDRNGNGRWDTGLYDKKQQPEEVFYYPLIVELKALWELEQDWNIHALPLDKQKQAEMKKQKPDEDKKKKKNQGDRSGNTGSRY